MSTSLFSGSLREWWDGVIPFAPWSLLLCAFWVVILLTSLKGVDRRDDLAHLTYSITLMAIGVCMYAATDLATMSQISVWNFIFVGGTTTIIAWLRWGVHGQASTLKFTSQKSQETKK
jgi:hypothetical protein